MTSRRRAPTAALTVARTSVALSARLTAVLQSAASEVRAKLLCRAMLQCQQYSRTPATVLPRCDVSLDQRHKGAVQAALDLSTLIDAFDHGRAPP